jgi:Co/Zn/Cd efflux system component
MKESSFLIPGLLMVIGIETFASFDSDRLAINAHAFDVASDIGAFGLVAIGGLVSGHLDNRGREHKAVHGEQIAVSIFNLIVLLGGALFIFLRALLSFRGDLSASGLENWWVIFGPALAIVVYWWMRQRVKELSVTDLTMASMEAHIKADLYVAMIVTVFTALSMSLQIGWLSPVSGLIVSAIYLWICSDLFRQIREESWYDKD